MIIGMAALIYALCDPDTEEVRYIGKTSAGIDDRMKNHLSMARRGDSAYKSRWIRTLLREGKNPEGVALELVYNKDSWEERERWWIRFCKDLGCRLTNGSAGGDGRTGYKHTDEFKEILRNRMMGNQYGKGKKWTPEQRKKMMASRDPKKISEKVRGSRHARAKINETDVYNILTRLANGEKAKTISMDYPISYSSIRIIACRRSWRHVEWP